MLTTINIITYPSISNFKTYSINISKLLSHFYVSIRRFITTLSRFLSKFTSLSLAILSSTLQMHIYHFTVRMVLRSINSSLFLFRPCFEQSLTSHCECWPSIIYARNDGIRDKSRRIPLNQSRSRAKRVVKGVWKLVKERLLPRFFTIFEIQGGRYETRDDEQQWSFPSCQLANLRLLQRMVLKLNYIEATIRLLSLHTGFCLV